MYVSVKPFLLLWRDVMRRCVWGVLVFLSVNVAGAANDGLPPKALVDVKTIEEAIEFQNSLEANGDIPPPEGTPWFEVRHGKVPVVITAPHATKAFREKSYRFADGAGTAALAIALHKLTGATVVYTTYFSPSDPNFYDDNDFKKTLGKLIADSKPMLVLDLHGSSPKRPYDIDIGTMDGASLRGRDELLQKLLSALRSDGIQNLSYNYFAASKNLTITRFAHSKGVSAIQLEISSTWLLPNAGDLDAHRFAQLTQALARYINDIARPANSKSAVEQ
jgi:hypothetical protein